MSGEKKSFQVNRGTHHFNVAKNREMGSNEFSLENVWAFDHIESHCINHRNLKQTRNRYPEFRDTGRYHTVCTG